MDISSEFVVEKAINGKLKVIGKVVYRSERDLLGDNDLEDIWDAANYGPANYEPIIVPNGIYKGLKCIHNDSNMWYIIIDEKTNHCNEDIIIRKHYNLEYGYYLQTDNRHIERDMWRYEKIDRIKDIFDKSPFIRFKR